MVRLKADLYRCVNARYLFQFQYGAIEGLLSVGFFGSLPLFQFQYGAIEGNMLRLKWQDRPDFNSSMVRLKVPTDPLVIAGIIFQFQYGAIEGHRRSEFLLLFSISIPVWCD